MHTSIATLSCRYGIPDDVHDKGARVFIEARKRQNLPEPEHTGRVDHLIHLSTGWLPGYINAELRAELSKLAAE